MQVIYHYPISYGDHLLDYSDFNDCDAAQENALKIIDNHGFFLAFTLIVTLIARNAPDETFSFILPEWLCFLRSLLKT